MRVLMTQMGLVNIAVSMPRGRLSMGLGRWF
jgi:hypothetical protein